MKGILITVIIIAVLVAAGVFVFNNDSDSNIDIDINGGGNSQNQTGSDNQQNNSGSSPATPQTHYVLIEGHAYKPSNLTIKAGDTVIWTNKDQKQHTVSSENYGKELDSPYFSYNKTFSHTFDQPGTHRYYCKPHPYMKAMIVVE